MWTSWPKIQAGSKAENRIDEHLSPKEIDTLLKVADRNHPGAADVASVERLMLIGFLRRIECMGLTWLEPTESGNAIIADEIEGRLNALNCIEARTNP